MSVGKQAATNQRSVRVLLRAAGDREIEELLLVKILTRAGKLRPFASREKTSIKLKERSTLEEDMYMGVLRHL